MVDLMKSMGLGDNDLISSTMVTRLLQRRISQTKEFHHNHVANSATEWYQQQSQD